MVETRHLTVTGRVQGVAYRAWTVGTAADLGLAGWVRNRRDGSVEITAEANRRRWTPWPSAAGGGRRWPGWTR